MVYYIMYESIWIFQLNSHDVFIFFFLFYSQIGWKHDELVKRLESKRLTKAAAWYQTKKQLVKLETQAKANVAGDLEETNKALAQFGY
jgi:hypothetical protein